MSVGKSEKSKNLAVSGCVSMWWLSSTNPDNRRASLSGQPCEIVWESSYLPNVLQTAQAYW